MMEASVMHCGSLLDCYSSRKSVGLGTRNWNNGNGGVRLKGKENCAFSLSSFCGGSVEFCSGWSPSLEWHTLHLRSPTPSGPSRRRINSLGQRTTNSIQLPTIDENILLIEEEQRLILKRKGAALSNDLRGTSIFLVGMMGSGKSTVGKYVSDGLGYHFFDSDKLVEDATGLTIKQMFRDGKEEEFRNAESEVITQLSSQLCLVVATGGGAVVRPQNWGYLRQAITVWLDVPLEALAERVVADGCESRPLLGQVSSESAYSQALNLLENLFEKRGGYYKNADASVCVAGLATMMGLGSISAVTPTMLAVQVLEEISTLIRKRNKRQDLEKHLSCTDPACHRSSCHHHGNC